jgi:hypothetical protein
MNTVSTQNSVCMTSNNSKYKLQNNETPNNFKIENELYLVINPETTDFTIGGLAFR